jgi:hypothetical protein
MLYVEYLYFDYSLLCYDAVYLTGGWQYFGGIVTSIFSIRHT